MNKTKFAAQVAQLTVERRPFVLATVVRARRPASVTPGDTAVVLPDGSIEGFVGGQCAETSVRLYALRALETGEPMLLRLIPGPAEGEVADDGIDGAVVEHNPCLSGGALEIFLEPQLPPARVIITGDSPIARAIAELATAAGYGVEAGAVTDLSQLSGATAVVVASHGHDEEDVLNAALSAGVPYVGLVASTKRGEAVRSALGLAPELAEQLHTPAGVDIGAQTPAEIAISILAELVVVLHSDPAPDRPTGEPANEPGAIVAVEPIDDEVYVPRSEAPAEEAEPARSAPNPGASPSAPSAEAGTDAPDADRVVSRKHAGAAMLARAFAGGKRDLSPAEDIPDPELDAAYAYHDADEAPAADLAGEPGEGESSLGQAEPGSTVQVATDPVCGMKVPITESTLHLDVAGNRKYFCGTGCRVAYAGRHAGDATTG
jgi:xanthine dehydrogenase accessory factor